MSYLLKPVSTSLFLTTFFVLGCASLNEQKSNCPNSKLPCASTDPITVMSGDDALLQQTAREAASEFTHLFGKDVPPTIIVPGGDISSSKSNALRANGFETLMPWLDQRSRNQLKENAIRKQITEQMKGMPEPLQEAALQQALAQINTKGAPPSDRSVELGALSHELGHMWFIAKFTKNGEIATGHAYGGWAPDWLDETAAVLMENRVLKDQRRQHFAKMKPEDRIPLSEFLEMEHPSAKAVKTLNLQKDSTLAKSGSNIRVLSGADAEAFLKASGGDRVVDFYAQVLVFSDYLIAQTGGTEIFPHIATALAHGKTISEWLTGNPFGLPVTISELEADWSSWDSKQP